MKINKTFIEDLLIIDPQLFKDDRGEGESTIAGGWVKDPVVGLNQWVVCYDFASLYPTTQRQFFISIITFKVNHFYILTFWN